MKRILILAAASLFLCSTASAGQGGGGESTKTKATPKKTSGATSATRAAMPDDGFNSFYAAFRQAVNKDDRAAIRNMMASRFEWAYDDESRDEALRNVDQMKLWRGLRNAVARTPVRCKQPYCNNRSGYHVWSSAKYRVEIMFERIDGQWKWSALLGD